MASIGGSSRAASQLDLRAPVAGSKRLAPRHPPQLPRVRRNLIEDLYPHAFWLEKYTRSNALEAGRIFADFTWQSCVAERPLTWKFYARPDVRDGFEKCPGCVAKYAPHVAQRMDVPQPWNRAALADCALTSQVYGSGPPLEVFDVHGRLVPEYRRPIRRASLSDHVEQLAINRVTERPPFGGIRFKT